MANDAEKSVPSGTAPRTPLLLHACCGPCSLEPVKYLRLEGFEPTICWTNPNIAPVAEHDRRLEVLRDWADSVAHVDVIVAGCDRDACIRFGQGRGIVDAVSDHDYFPPGFMFPANEGRLVLREHFGVIFVHAKSF